MNISQENMNIKILILCTGNSCRSQMAEGYLRSFDASLRVYSAGVRPEKKISPYAVRVMMEDGIDISANAPKSVEQFTEMSFDYVITVCDSAKQDCPVFLGRVRHLLHIGFEDPYNAKGSDDEIMAKYRQVRDQIKSGFYDFFVQLPK
jgi:arsenate reductase